MLGADESVTQAFGLLRGIGEDVLALVGERKVHKRGDLLSRPPVSLDLPVKAFRRLLRGKKSRRQRSILTEQAEEEELGLNLGRAELAGLIAGEEDRAAGFLVVALEHADIVRLERDGVMK